jgi:1,5-anhydro-D-fructose reductase (1,5-anhydro-D-mannitol-forming)
VPISAHFSGRKVVRWGIIGCGDVTEVKSGPAFQNALGSALVAVMRRNGSLAADFARRHNVARWYDNADALIDDKEVDAVYVATPPDSHARYAIKVAEAGKPAYVEKPMARHGPECDRMLEAFAAAKLPLFVAYYRRLLPRFVAAGQLIQGGRVGRITGISYRTAAPKHLAPKGWRFDAAVGGGGVFVDTVSHVLDLLDFLVGPLTEAEGNAANLASAYAVEDTVALAFRAAGVPGVMSCNFANATFEDSLRISGTEGELACSVFGSDPLRLQTSKGIETIDRPNPRHVQQPLIQSVVDDLLGKGRCPSTGESALRTTRVIDRVLGPYYGGRDDEFWTRPETWPGRRRP